MVPYTRGAEQSRPAAAVIAEARRLVAQGAREITLLGQNVNAWHGEAPDGGTWGLGRLLRELAELPGLLRLRYTTSHPRDMDDELIAAHRDLPALMPFLHLPVQSGSDRVLAAMNRRHTAADYLRLVEKLRAARPDLALSSDFIVGHPGETEADFAGDAGAGARGRLRPGVQLQVFAAARHAGRRRARAGAGGGEGAPAAELQALLREQQARFNARLRRADAAGAVHRPGPPSRPGRRPLTLSSAGACNRAGRPDRPRRFRWRSPPRSPILCLEPSPRREPALEPEPPSPAIHRRLPPGGKAVTLQFSDNTLLPLLLGDHDRHLVRIEQALGVRLSCRGNRVAITGEPSRVDAAQAMLQGLWRRLERGESVGRPDVEAAIRLADADTDPRLPLSDVPAIRTRRGAVAAAQRRARRLTWRRWRA